MASATALPHTAEIATTTVDEFSAARELARIDWLTLDAEGWDGMILRGAERMLSERRVSVLEFEFSPRAWALALRVSEAEATAQLSDVLGMVQRRGYRCFWQGGRVMRPPASAGAAPPPLLAEVGQLAGCVAIGRVGNVVCAHAAPVVEKLQGLAGGRSRV